MPKALKINADGSLGWEKPANKYNNQHVFMCVRCCHVVESKMSALDCCSWKNPKKIHEFASEKEAKRYVELKWLQENRMIEALEIQPAFPMKVQGQLVCTYVADFSYTDRTTKQRVIEDVKSKPTKTRLYEVKKKLLKALYNIDVVEVTV